MFVDPRHILNDMESNDDGKNERLKGDDGIMEFNVIAIVEQNEHLMGGIVESNETINSSTPTKNVVTQLVTIMQKITNECKESDVTFCEHATSQSQMHFYT